MKIIKLVNDLGFGGTQRCAQNYAIALKNAGHEVLVLAYSQLGPRAEVLEEKGIAVGLVDRRNAIREITDFAPDLIHIHREGSYHSKTSPLLVKIRQNCPRVAIVETNVFSRFDDRLPGGVVDLHLQLSDWCLVKYCLWGRNRKAESNATVVPYMVDDRRFCPAGNDAVAQFREDLGIPREAFVFGRIGSPIRWKWDPVVIDCFEQIESIPAYLVLVAPPKNIVERVGQLSLEKRERVRLVPLIETDEELCAAFSSFDVFLHAAKIGESFGMVFGESLLCGTPIITMGTPLKDNTQEFLVPDCGGGAVARSPAGMVDLMNAAIEQQDSWSAKGREGATIVKRLFSESAVIKQLEGAYEISLQVRAGADLHESLKSQFSEARARVVDVLRAYSLKVRILFWVLHRPAIYRIYRRLKRR